MTTRYVGFSIQKIGRLSSSKSLTVPPPMAVTTATTTTPKRSMHLRPAVSAPLTANTATPNRSRTYRPTPDRLASRRRCLHGSPVAREL